MKKAITLLLAIVMCLSLCACGKAGDYEAAIALMEAGNYEEAIVAFTELGDYEDSIQKLEECENILSYAEAIALFEGEQYEDALAIFTALGNYQDSQEKKVECENALAYQNAVDAIASGDYEKAYTTLVPLGEYKDVPELLTHFKKVEITSENWSEYFIMVEEPEYIKNDFNENADIHFNYYFSLNENAERHIFNSMESEVVLEIAFTTIARDVQFEKVSDKYEVVPINYSGPVIEESCTYIFGMGQSEKSSFYYTSKLEIPAMEPGAPTSAWFLLDNYDVIRAQGSIFLYE